MEKNKTPFDEKNMRKFENLNEAVKFYSEQKISPRKITVLFYKTYTIAIGRLFLNLNSINRLGDLDKFLSTLFNGNQSKIMQFYEKREEWNTKFEPKRK